MKALRAYLRSPAGMIGAVLLLAVIAAALSADMIFPRDPLSLAGRPLQWPGANPRLPLGTDNLGRDIAAFLFHGARVSLLIGLVGWTAPCRLVRAEFLSLRGREFVLAARGLGMRDARLILGEVLPNALPPVIVYASVTMAIAILLESALAFLGLSDPNVASWGNMIGAGRSVLRTEWYVSAIPGAAILVTVLAFSLVGQGLNDALNPRMQVL